MKVKITLGNAEFEVSDATPAELVEFARASSTFKTAPTPSSDVVAVTKKALTVTTQGNTKKKINRPEHYNAWKSAEIAEIASIIVNLGPGREHYAPAVAKIMQSKTGNKRTYKVLAGMGYNIARYLTEGVLGNLAKSTIKALNEAGYTAGMMTSRPNPTTNLLGDVRHIPVREA